MGAQKKHLIEMILLSTHNICFGVEMRKLGFNYWYALLSIGLLHGEALLLSGRVLDSRSRGCRVQPHGGHCVVTLSKTLYPLLSTGSTQEDQF